MKNPFKSGDIKIHRTVVTEEKLARFESGLVHPVYGTFALGKDAEWACRLFVLEMKEEGEEGIGTFLSIEHQSPAPLGSELEIVATLLEVEGNEVRCRYHVHWEKRLIATGLQNQKIISHDRFVEMVRKLKGKV